MSTTAVRRLIVRCAFVCVFLVTAIESNADVPDWVTDLIYEVTDNPDVVHYSSFSDIDCSVEYSEIEKIIKDELIRSRIKPIHWLDRPEGSDGLIVLDVELNCLERDGLNPIFRIDVYFALYWFEDGAYTGTLLIDWDFGRFGVGDGDYILRSVEDSVEDAITAYVKANFDL